MWSAQDIDAMVEDELQIEHEKQLYELAGMEIEAQCHAAAAPPSDTALPVVTSPRVRNHNKIGAVGGVEARRFAVC